MNMYYFVRMHAFEKLHMAGFSQPQQYFAAGCIFSDFAIAVIFYPVIKTS